MKYIGTAFERAKLAKKYADEANDRLAEIMASQLPEKKSKE